MKKVFIILLMIWVLSFQMHVIADENAEILNTPVSVDCENMTANGPLVSDVGTWSYLDALSSVKIKPAENPSKTGINTSDKSIVIDQPADETERPRVLYTFGSSYSGKFSIEMKIYVPAENVQTVSLFFYNSNRSKSVNLFIDSANGLRDAKNTSIKYPSNLDSWNNVWHKIKVEFDTITPSYSFYLDGTLCCTYTLDCAEISSICLKPNNANTGKRTVLYIDDILLVQDFTEEIATALDSITDASISNESLSAVTSDLLTLPTTYENVSFEWKSDNLDAISDSGKVTRRGYSDNAGMTVSVTKVGEYSLTEEQKALCTKTFDITVSGDPDVTALEKLEEYVNVKFALNRLTDSEQGKIVKSLTGIPEGGTFEDTKYTISDATNGITIEFQSSDSDYLRADGLVVRPDSDSEDAEVTLTITARGDGAEYSAERSFTVIKEEDPFAILTEAMKNITYDDLVTEESYVISETTGAYISKKLNLPTEGINGTTIEWNADNGKILPDGTLIRGATDTYTVLTGTFTYVYNDVPYQDQKEFVFTLKISQQAMIEADYNAIDSTDWSEKKEDFSLPNVGAIYGGTISWSSDNAAIEIVNDNCAVVKRPSFDAGDAIVTLTATITVEGTSEERYFSVTITKLPSDSECVDMAYENLTWNNISWEEENDVSRNLTFVSEEMNGVIVIWSTTNTDVIGTDGTVTTPEEDTEVTITAELSKGTVNLSKSFLVTVRAFENVEQRLERAKMALLFRTICADPIDNVQNNLNLVTEWKYGTTVEWSSSDTDALDNLTGLISRPVMGNGKTAVMLTAKISYKGKSIEKQFFVQIAETEVMITRLNENCESMAVGETTLKSDYGDWLSPVVSGSVFTVCDTKNEVIPGLNISGESNKAIKIQKNGGDIETNSSPYFVYSVPEDSPLSGKVEASMRLFVGKDTNRAFRIQMRSVSDAAQISLYLNEGNVQALFNGALCPLSTNPEHFKFGEWNDIELLINTSQKRYKFYINGFCVSDSYTDNDSEYGIPFNYYANEASPTALRGFAIGINPDTASAAIAFVDDMKVKFYPEYSKEIQELAETFDSEFLSQNNVNYLIEDLILPQFNSDMISVEYHSSNVAVIDDDGSVTRGEEEQKVVFVAQIKYGNELLRKAYILTVKPKAYIPLTDDECVYQDLLDIEEYLLKTYNFNNIKNDIVLSDISVNGSEITLSSSDRSVISEKGKVTRGSLDKKVTITISVRKNSAERSKSFEFIVKAAQQSAGSGSVSSLGSLGTYGANIKPNTGIEIGKEENVNTQLFGDVPAQYWAYEYIQDLRRRGVVDGYNGNFMPEDRVTREQFVKMLVEALGLKQINKSYFEDVLLEEWYAKYISAAVEEGIVKGDGKRFGVGECISRQDMAVMVSRALKLGNTIIAAEFTDNDEIADYAKEAVYAMKEAGLINGRENNSFAPADTATRAETAAIIYRMLKK